MSRVEIFLRRQGLWDEVWNVEQSQGGSGGEYNLEGKINKYFFKEADCGQSSCRSPADQTAPRSEQTQSNSSLHPNPVEGSDRPTE